MSIFQAAIQGIIQGLTEFLPVSSSGHLSLYQHFTGNSGEGALLFSAVLHLGTLLAVFVAFRHTIAAMILEIFRIIKSIFTGKFSLKTLNPEGRAVIMMIVSLLLLIPFYIFKDFFEGTAQDNDIIIEGVCFIYTAALLYLSDRRMHGTKTFGKITIKDAVTVGIFQGVALLPGVSRSGSTISAGRFCGFEKETAIEYSFILGIPAIAGGSLLEAGEAIKSGACSIQPAAFAVGFITAAIVGICAIKAVKLLMKTNKFSIFSIYTLIIGIIAVSVGIYERVTAV
ncbi:MAG: undecaprenyl-diphosphate phosphatase [Porcipelethomonas sp.]